MCLDGNRNPLKEQLRTDKAWVKDGESYILCKTFLLIFQGSILPEALEAYFASFPPSLALHMYSGLG